MNYITSAVLLPLLFVAWFIWTGSGVVQAGTYIARNDLELLVLVSTSPSAEILEMCCHVSYGVLGINSGLLSYLVLTLPNCYTPSSPAL